MSAELVPAATSPDDIAEMPPEQRGQLITRALVESRSWLAVATKGTDPTPIAHFKAWAATVAEMTRQKGLAEDIQLDALEMVRRAERGIGLAIRNGQEAGEVRRQGETSRPANQHGPATRAVFPVREKSSPGDFVKTSAEIERVYGVTDGVTDEDHEQALAEARAEGNLSAANVLRKVRRAADARTKLPRSERVRQIQELADEKLSSHQIAERIGIRADRVREIARQNDVEIPADRIMLRTKRIDPVRVIRSTVEDIAASLEATWNLIRPQDFEQLDPTEANEWVQSLDESLRSLRRLRKELSNVAEYYQ